MTALLCLLAFCVIAAALTVVVRCEQRGVPAPHPMICAFERPAPSR